MKKLFSTIALFAALTLTSCGVNQPSSSAQKSSSSTKPSTASQQPSSSQTPSSSAAPKHYHTWEVETPVEASNGGVAYDFVKCSGCQKKGLMVAAAKGTATGTPKDAPEGCVKLGKNGDTLTLQFYLAEAKSGILYQRGSMDYWYEDSNNNQNKTYYSQNSGNTDESAGIGNFKCEVGLEGALQEVSIADKTSVTFGDMLPEEGGSEYGGHQWSALGDCEIGAVSLSAGLNTIKYTRVDSYNLAVHDFVVVFNA